MCDRNCLGTILFYSLIISTLGLRIKEVCLLTLWASDIDSLIAPNLFLHGKLQWFLFQDFSKNWKSLILIVEVVGLRRPNSTQRKYKQFGKCKEPKTVLAPAILLLGPRQFLLFIFIYLLVFGLYNSSVIWFWSTCQNLGSGCYFWLLYGSYRTRLNIKVNIWVQWRHPWKSGFSCIFLLHSVKWTWGGGSKLIRKGQVHIFICSFWRSVKVYLWKPGSTFFPCNQRNEITPTHYWNTALIFIADAFLD